MKSMSKIPWLCPFSLQLGQFAWFDFGVIEPDLLSDDKCVRFGTLLVKLSFVFLLALGDVFLNQSLRTFKAEKCQKGIRLPRPTDLLSGEVLCQGSTGNLA